MNRRGPIIVTLRNMTNFELVATYNRYINILGRDVNKIYDRMDLDKIAEKYGTYGVLCLAYFGDFDPSAQFYNLDEKGYIQSIKAADLESYINLIEVAEYCVANNENLNSPEIEEILRGGNNV